MAIESRVCKPRLRLGASVQFSLPPSIFLAVSPFFSRLANYRAALVYGSDISERKRKANLSLYKTLEAHGVVRRRGFHIFLRIDSDMTMRLSAIGPRPLFCTRNIPGTHLLRADYTRGPYCGWKYWAIWEGQWSRLESNPRAYGLCIVPEASTLPNASDEVVRLFIYSLNVIYFHFFYSASFVFKQSDCVTRYNLSLNRNDFNSLFLFQMSLFHYSNCCFMIGTFYFLFLKCPYNFLQLRGKFTFITMSYKHYCSWNIYTQFKARS